MMSKDIFKNLVLPSDEEVKRETKGVKQSAKLTGRKRPDQSTRVSGKKNPMAGKTSPNKGKSMPQITEKIKGKKKPEGFGEKISKRRKELGFGNTMGGKKRPEHSQRMKEHNPGIEKTQVAWKCRHCGKEGVGSSNYVRWHGDNCKENLFKDLVLPNDDDIKHETHIVKIKQAIKGVPKTEQHKKNRKAAMPDQSGVNNPFYNKTHTDEVRKKISMLKKGKTPANKGSSHTQEALKKMRKPRSEEGKANMRGPREKKTCPHCGFVGAGGNMGRYHFDNCKHK